MRKVYNAVALRDFTETDIPLKVDWINNPHNNTYLHYDLPLTNEKTLCWFRQKDNSRRVDCTIEFNNEPVGIIGLLSIDPINRRAEYYITMGNEAFKGRGIAAIATMLLLEYAFSELELNKVYLLVDADNTRACRLYERVGMTLEGVLREELLRRGELIDRKRYAILEKDWNRGWRDEWA